MRPAFREDKTTQAALHLLKLRGGQMSYMKLIKLLYLADREALIRWGRPITFDQYVSMQHGPVLSRTLDLINEGPAPNVESLWRRCISAPENYDVRLIDDCGTDRLSRAEVDLLGEVFGQFGHMPRWQLVDWLHDNLPEWRDPQGSGTPILPRDILTAAGRTPAEIAQIESELEEEALADQLLG